MVIKNPTYVRFKDWASKTSLGEDFYKRSNFPNSILCCYFCKENKHIEFLILGDYKEYIYNICDENCLNLYILSRN